jgi:hypothetical protein
MDEHDRERSESIEVSQELNNGLTDVKGQENHQSNLNLSMTLRPQHESAQESHAESSDSEGTSQGNGQRIRVEKKYRRGEEEDQSDNAFEKRIGKVQKFHSNEKIV